MAWRLHAGSEAAVIVSQEWNVARELLDIFVALPGDLGETLLGLAYWIGGSPPTSTSEHDNGPVGVGS
jgi:hypothetical protein